MTNERKPMAKDKEPKLGLEDLEFEQLDGPKALLKLGDEVRLVDQADIFRAQKKFAQAVQLTY